MDDDLPTIKRAPQFQGPDGFWYCGECKQEIINHLPTCETHNAYKTWYRKVCEQPNIPRPEGMCKGCDARVEGPHRFGCLVAGARASQVVLPAIRNPDGTFSIAKRD